MSQPIDPGRRRFLGTAAITLAAAPFAMSVALFAQSGDAKPGAGAVRPGAHTSFAALKQIEAGVLTIGYAEAGPADGPVVILLHGWPYDIYAFADVVPVLASAGFRVIAPWLRGYGTTRFLSDDTPRNGQQGALATDVIALMDALKIDEAWSPATDLAARLKWNFDDATFERSAASFDNPDQSPS